MSDQRPRRDPRAPCRLIAEGSNSSSSSSSKKTSCSSSNKTSINQQINGSSSSSKKRLDLFSHRIKHKIEKQFKGKGKSKALNDFVEIYYDNPKCIKCRCDILEGPPYDLCQECQQNELLQIKFKSTYHGYSLTTKVNYVEGDIIGLLPLEPYVNIDITNFTKNTLEDNKMMLGDYHPFVSHNPQESFITETQFNERYKNVIKADDNEAIPPFAYGSKEKGFYDVLNPGQLSYANSVISPEEANVKMEFSRPEDGVRYIYFVATKAISMGGEIRPFYPFLHNEKNWYSIEMEFGEEFFSNRNKKAIQILMGYPPEGAEKRKNLLSLIDQGAKFQPIIEKKERINEIIQLDEDLENDTIRPYSKTLLLNERKRLCQGLDNCSVTNLQDAKSKLEIETTRIINTGVSIVLTQACLPQTPQQVYVFKFHKTGFALNAWTKKMPNIKVLMDNNVPQFTPRDAEAKEFTMDDFVIEVNDEFECNVNTQCLPSTMLPSHNLAYWCQCGFVTCSMDLLFTEEKRHRFEHKRTITPPKCLHRWSNIRITKFICNRCRSGTGSVWMVPRQYDAESEDDKNFDSLRFVKSCSCILDNSELNALYNKFIDPTNPVVDQTNSDDSDVIDVISI